MREQVATPVFSPSIERKKTSINLSRRDEINDNSRRRLGGGYLGYLKPIVHMPGERLRGGSSILTSRDQEVDNHVPEPAKEKMKEDLKSETESERTKRKAADESVVLLQWGHKKRPRGNRVEAKHATDESSVLSKSAVRAERRMVKAEREESGAVQATGVTTKGGQSSLKSYRASGVREAATTESAKRNALELRPCSPDHKLHSLPAALPLPSSPADPQPNPSPALPCSFTPAQNGSDASPLPKLDLDLFEWPRILLSLSRKEKEDDFLSIKGSKLPQRPKRRPKVVEKAIHYCSPGTWLSDLARGRYDVREKKSVKKKPRGLKAMESMDSDSD